MWSWIASRVLRNRAGILVVLGLITVFMGYMARDVEMSFKFGGLLPKTDSAYIDYQNFLSEFSEDGNVIVLGVQGEKFYTPEVFSAWHHLGNDLKRIDGIDSVFSEANLFTLVRDDSLKRFKLAPVGPVPPNSQAELDTLLKHVRDLPFYNGLLYNDSTRASLMMVFVDAPLFNTKERGKVMKALEERVAAFEAVGVPVHYSGLPFIRVKTVDLVRGELPMFVGLAVGVTALLLLLFFWSWRVMWMSLVVVSVSVIWSFGTIGILGYKLTMLTSVIPPLLIVIGVPNCVFLINKYHHEYVRHGNQIKALQRVIARVGTAAFMTNATTAMGFATFMVTYSDVLREFGLIASLNIMSLYVLAILLIPIFFSYQKPPKPRHTSHLDRPWLDRITAFIVGTVMDRRPAVFLAMGGFLVIGLVGFSRLRNESRIVDDLPANSRVLTDLRFFERNFNGVMPLEVLVDTKKKGGALRDATLKRIVKLEDTLATYDEFSKPLSIADAVKFTRQACYGGNPDRYSLITSREKSFILPYLDGAGDKDGMAKAFLDSTRQRTRITVQMADVGTERMEVLLDRLAPQLDSLFSPDKYRVTMTGTSVVFLKGSAYMVSNLVISLAIAIVLIGLLMALIFNSLRMVLVTLVPNLVPLLTTAGLMGYLSIPIKPSTILVFSIAFGIAVDNAIHLLAKYRLELKQGLPHRQAVEHALRETAVGVIYTAVVLFFGFSMFVLSKFGGVQALGSLVSLTLLVAFFTNLFVLPSLLLSFDRKIATRDFQEPLLEIMDEGDDIDLDELQVEGEGTNGRSAPEGSEATDRTA